MCPVAPARSRIPHTHTSYGTVHTNLAGAPNGTAQPRNWARGGEVSALPRLTPPLFKRDGVGFHRDFIPPPLPYPQVSAPAVRPARWCKPQLACAFPTNLEPARSGLRVCAGHRPAAPEPDDRQNRAVFDTPAWYMRRGLRPRFRRSEALSRTRWQVKDSNLRSSRDGFTDHGRQARDQRKRPFHRQLTCVFPTDIRRQPTTADGSRTPNEQLLRRLGDSRDAGRPTLVLHSHIFRRGYRPLVAQVLP